MLDSHSKSVNVWLRLIGHADYLGRADAKAGLSQLGGHVKHVGQGKSPLSQD